jgi:hypothetical protein
MTGGHFCACAVMNVPNSRGDMIIALRPGRSRTDRVEVSKARQDLLAQRTPAIALKNAFRTRQYCQFLLVVV